MSTTQEPEVHVLPRKGLGKSPLESSALFGHSPFSSMASEQIVMASNKLSGPVHS